jgi:hypothetical protein
MSDPADSLPDDPATLKAMLLAERTRAERLAQIIKEMQRHRFGRRAETLPENQLLLGFEEVEQTAASDEANQEATSPAEREVRAAKRRTNRGSLPSHLPRIETVASPSTVRPSPTGWAALPSFCDRCTSGCSPS